MANSDGNSSILKIRVIGDSDNCRTVESGNWGIVESEKAMAKADGDSWFTVILKLEIRNLKLETLNLKPETIFFTVNCQLSIVHCQQPIANC